MSTPQQLALINSAKQQKPTQQKPTTTTTSAPDPRNSTTANNNNSNSETKDAPIPEKPKNPNANNNEPKNLTSNNDDTSSKNSKPKETSLLDKFLGLISPQNEIDKTDQKNKAKQLTAAELAEEDLKEDCLEFANNVTKFSTNKRALYIYLFRHMEKVMKCWKNVSKNPEKIISEISESKKTKLLQKHLDSDPKSKHKKRIAVLKEVYQSLKQVTEEISEMIAQERDVDIAELKKKSVELMELSKRLFMIALEVKDMLDRKLYLPIPEEQLLKQLDNMLERVKKDTYTVATVGLEKSGKSTWTNCQVGFALVPTSSKRCTMVITKIRNNLKGAEMKNAIEAYIYFHDKQSFEQNLEEVKQQERLKSQTSKEAKRSSLIENKEEEEEPTVSIFDKEESIRAAFNSIKQPVLKIEGEEAEVKAQVNQYIANEVYVYSVKGVDIFLSELKGEFPFELVDVPGFDTTIQRQKEMTREMIRKSDATIIVYDGHKPTFNDPFTSLLQTIKEYGGLNPLQKSFVVVTSLDKSANTREGLENYREVVSQFVKEGIPENRIFACCPAYDFLMKESEQRQLTDEEVATLKKLQANYNHFTFLENGTFTASSNIMDFVTKDLPLVRAKEALDLSAVVLEFTERLMNSDNLFSDKELNIDKESSMKKLWKEKFKSAKDQGWYFIWNKTATFLDSAINEFNRLVDKIMREHEIELAKRIPYSESNYRAVDVESIESEARKQLCIDTVEALEKNSMIISSEIYTVCENLVQTILKELDIERSSEFRVENMITKENTLTAVQYQIIRFGFPAANAFLRWRKNHPNRSIAINDLIEACPEIAPYFETKDTKKKETNTKKEANTKKEEQDGSSSD